MSVQASNIFTVTEISHSIKDVLEGAFAFLKIKGEISNFKLHSSGHSYFQLKDNKCQISCVMFKGQRRKTTIFKDGDQVILTGKISVFEARGSYQIIAYSIELIGLGDLLIAFERLKQELKELGYFEKSHKNRIPRFPKTVGVITSPTGAVIQDMLHVLKKPMQTFKILLNPVNVQGAEAKEQISDAINYFNRRKNVDLIIICRGGGSLEDLWPFNEQIVAKSIFESKIPLISAVGHETDITIADFVADYRAATPTAAAQVIIKSQEVLKERIEKLRPLMKSRIQKELEHCKNNLLRYHNSAIFQTPSLVLSELFLKFDAINLELDRKACETFILFKQKLQNMQNQLKLLHPKVRLVEFKKRLHSFHKSFKLLPHSLNEKKSTLKSLYEHLQSINPERILRKGFCIPFQENTDFIIMGAEKIKKDQNITLRFYDGKVNTQVKEVSYERKKSTKKL